MSEVKLRASAASASLDVALATRLSARERKKSMMTESDDDRRRPPGEQDLGLARDKAVDGLIGDPARGAEKQAGFGQGGDAFEFGMAVMMVVVRRLVAHAHGEEGDHRGAEIGEAVDRFRQDAERAGEQACDQLGDGQAGAGGHRDEGDGLFFGSGHAAV